MVLLLAIILSWLATDQIPTSTLSNLSPSHTHTYMHTLWYKPSFHGSAEHSCIQSARSALSKCSLPPQPSSKIYGLATLSCVISQLFHTTWAWFGAFCVFSLGRLSQQWQAQSERSRSGVSGDAWQRWTKRGGPRWGRGGKRESYGPGPEEQLVSQDDWLIKGGNVTEDSFWEWEQGLCDK